MIISSVENSLTFTKTSQNLIEFFFILYFLTMNLLVDLFKEKEELF